MSNDEWSMADSIEKIMNAMNDKGLSPEDVFDQMDSDQDGRINGPELHKGLSNLVGDLLSPAQISTIIQTLDTNEDHRIDIDELRTALTNSEEE